MWFLVAMAGGLERRPGAADWPMISRIIAPPSLMGETEEAQPPRPVNTFLSIQTLAILCMGIVAFGCGTAGGVLLAKVMNLFLKEKINPLIGSAGVSAVPMAARVSQVVGQKENPGNFLLMHAMGPNVAGVIGSAIAAGVLMSLFS